MVDVVLHEKVVRADFIHDGQRLVGAGEEETGDVVAVDRLYQKPDAGFLQRGCREAEVADQRGVRMLTRDARQLTCGQASAFA